MEHWIRRETIYKGRIVTLSTGTVRLENGNEAQREVLDHPGAVGIVPCLGDSVVLVRQYRIAVEKYILEIPAGKLEGNESAKDRARAELEEETGYRAAKLEYVGNFYPSAGILNEKVHLYLAFDLTKTVQRLEEDEDIEIIEMSLEEVRERLAKNAFEDAKTIIGLSALLARQTAR